MSYLLLFHQDTSASCCCNQTGCNKPVSLSQLSYTPQHPLGPSPQHGESRAKITATYAVGAAVLLLLLLLLGIFITLGLRKCKQRQDAQYAYVYSELTADLAEESDKDDDTLLVPWVAMAMTTREMNTKSARVYSYGKNLQMITQLRMCGLAMFPIYQLIVTLCCNVAC